MKTKKTASGIRVYCSHDKIVPIDELVPNPRNPNQHPDEQIELLAKIIQQNGWRNAITVSNLSGMIVKGHGRYQAAMLAGLDEALVDFQDYESRDAEIKDLIADNKISELSEIDTKEARALIESLDSYQVETDFDLSDFGFTNDEILEYFPDERQGETADDEVPEVDEAEVKTKTGDLYLLGEHRLLCGDATRAEDVGRLMDGKKADMVFTDPPYNVDYEGYTEDSLKIDSDKMKSDEYIKFLNSIFANYVNSVKRSWSFYICHADAWQMITEQAMNKCGIELRNQIIWAKQTFAWGNNRYKFRHEPIFYAHIKGEKDQWYGNKSAHTLWEIPKPSANRSHPTMKPISLIEIAMQNSSKGDDIILDFFMGSGSTLIASEKLRRICFGIEIDPFYCDVVVKRWEDYTGETAKLT